MPGSKPLLDSRPHVAESSPRDGFPFLGSHRKFLEALRPSIPAAPDRSARGVGRGDPLGVCSVSPLDLLLLETCTLRTL